MSEDFQSIDAELNLKKKNREFQGLFWMGVKASEPLERIT
jgi:hypothetical protein